MSFEHGAFINFSSKKFERIKAPKKNKYEYLLNTQIYSGKGSEYWNNLYSNGKKVPKSNIPRFKWHPN
jgi:hypothetical protein